LVTFADPNVAQGNLYTYQVAATDGVITTAFSTPATVDLTQAAPNAPTLLTVDLLSATQVSLSWTDTAVETSFVVERSNDGGLTFAPIATLPADSVSYIDGTVVAPNTYTYQVGARTPEAHRTRTS